VLDIEKISEDLVMVEVNPMTGAILRSYGGLTTVKEILWTRKFANPGESRFQSHPKSCNLELLVGKNELVTSP